MGEVAVVEVVEDELMVVDALELEPEAEDDEEEVVLDDVLSCCVFVRKYAATPATAIITITMTAATVVETARSLVLDERSSFKVLQIQAGRTSY